MPQLSVQEAALSGFTDFIIIDHSDLTAAATTETITYAVSAGDVVTAAAYATGTQFDGGATSELTITVGETDADGFLAASSIHADATPVDYAANTGDLLDGTTTVGHTFTADDTIDILFTATGANVSVLDAGEVRVYFTIARLVDLASGTA